MKNHKKLLLCLFSGLLGISINTYAMKNIHMLTLNNFEIECDYWNEELIKCAKNDDIKGVENALKKGAKVDYFEGETKEKFIQGMIWGDRALKIAIGYQQNAPMVKLLLDYKASPNSLQIGENEPLRYILESNNSASKSAIEIVKLLLKYGANPNPLKLRTFSYTRGSFRSERAVNGQSLICIAAESHNIEALKILLKAGAYVSEPSLNDNDMVTSVYLKRFFPTERKAIDLLCNMEDFEYMTFSSKGYNPASLILYSDLDKDSRALMLYKTLTNKKYLKTLYATYKFAKDNKRQKELRILLNGCKDQDIKDSGETYEMQESLLNKIDGKLTDIEIKCVKQ